MDLVQLPEVIFDAQPVGLIVFNNDPPELHGGIPQNPVIADPIIYYPGIQRLNTIPHFGSSTFLIAAGYNGLVYCDSGQGLVSTSHEGQHRQLLVSSKKTVRAMALHYTNDFIYAFIAHNKGKIKVWRSDRPEEGSLPVFMRFKTLTTPKDMVKHIILPWRNPHQNAIFALCISDDSKFLYSVSGDNTLRTWFIRNTDYKLVDKIRNDRGVITALAVGPSVIFCGTSEGVIRILRRVEHGSKGDRVRHKLIAHLTVRDGYFERPTVSALLFHTVDFISSWLYVGSSDGDVMCWRNLSLDETDADHLEPEILSIGHQSEVTSLACSEHFVFSGSKDETINAWRRVGLYHTFALSLEHSHWVSSIVVQNDWQDNANDRCIIYSSSVDGTLKIWRIYELPPNNVN